MNKFIEKKNPTLWIEVPEKRENNVRMSEKNIPTKEEEKTCAKCRKSLQEQPK